jgi:all-trans-retinol 13,14-reductase
MIRANAPWDGIVIGSGIGGLACAAALARMGQKILVVEQHYVAGGLTQTFSRDGFRWDVGVHYLSEMHPGGESRKLIDWLSGGAIDFASMGDMYDILHFPDNFELKVPRTEAAFRAALQSRFPQSSKGLDAYFAALAEAERAIRAVFVGRGLPSALAGIFGLWRGRAIARWVGRTSADVFAETIDDVRLRAVLSAQRANYGGMALDQTSFGEQALITRHFFNGGFYPVGGAGIFAQKLIPVIEQAGGALRLRTKVTRLLVEKGVAVGIETADGAQIRAKNLFSDAGARNTVGWLPAEGQASAWAQDILALAPSPCHLVLYLGLQGDIEANGATLANHWIHETWDVDDGVWRDPAGSPPPGVFVSFPSLKDPAHEPGPQQRHTAEVLAVADWASFARWRDSQRLDRPDDYKTFKAAIERQLFAQFARHFPALAPLVVARELSTPLSTLSFTGAWQGGSYGLDVSPRRFLSGSLRARTPIPGLFLTGQDVVSPGVTGAMMGGVVAAASVQPLLFRHLMSSSG